MSLTFTCLNGDSLVSVRGTIREVSKNTDLGLSWEESQTMPRLFPIPARNPRKGPRRLERLQWVKDRKCCGKVHNELFQLCLHASSPAWVPVKAEYVRWQNRKKHTRPFVLPKGIPAMFITLDIKLDKYTEVWTSKHSSVPYKRPLLEKVPFFISLRVWDSLSCWQDLEALLLMMFSLGLLA